MSSVSLYWTRGPSHVLLISSRQLIIHSLTSLVDGLTQSLKILTCKNMMCEAVVLSFKAVVTYDLTFFRFYECRFGIISFSYSVLTATDNQNVYATWLKNYALRYRRENLHTFLFILSYTESERLDIDTFYSPSIEIRISVSKHNSSASKADLISASSSYSTDRVRRDLQRGQDLLSTQLNWRLTYTTQC